MLGRQAYREYLEAAFEQTPDFRFIPATLEIDGNIALSTICSRGVTPDRLRVRTRHRPRDALRRRPPHRRGPLLHADQMAEARTFFATLAAATAPGHRDRRPQPVTGAIDRYAAGATEAAEFSSEALAAEIDCVRSTGDVASRPRRAAASPSRPTSAPFEELFETFTNEPVADPGRPRRPRSAGSRRRDGLGGADARRLTRADEAGLVSRQRRPSTRRISISRSTSSTSASSLGEGAADAYMIRRAGDVARAPEQPTPRLRTGRSIRPTAPSPTTAS